MSAPEWPGGIPAGHRGYAPETFRERLLMMRGRASLTQQQLAARLGVSTRTIQYWETGVSYPAGTNLKGLIATYLELHAFTPGREREDAEALWDAVSLEAPRLSAPFDASWFEAQRARRPPRQPTATKEGAVARRRQDWGEAPELAAFHGRAAELELLRRWVLHERCRLVVLFGMGGIGKTALATRLAADLAPEFDVVYWRSLRNAPPVGEWLAGAIRCLSAQRLTPATDEASCLLQLVELLREQRCLLILDNLETVLASSQPAVRYREHTSYGDVLRRVGESRHGGCVLVTTREKPRELSRLEWPLAPTRSLRLGGLDLGAGRALLEDAGLHDKHALAHELVERYGGNALALRIVADTVGELFGGEIAAFLRQTGAVYGDIRRLLDGQLERVSALETELLYQLAIDREPVSLADIQAEVMPRVTRGEALEAIEALHRRSLVERGDTAASFTLQPVILEYMTDRLVSAFADEISGGRLDLVRRYPHVKARAKDWVRRSQEQLIGSPLLARLEVLGSATAVEEKLIELLSMLRAEPEVVQGCAPGNLVNLLRQQRGNLRGVDLSGLVLRHVYLAEVEAQDARLSGAHLIDAVIADAYSFGFSLAMSADGHYLAVGGSGGDAHVWQIADRTLIVSVRGHARDVMAVALSGDGQVLATGGIDGVIKLWDTAAGQLLTSLQGPTALVWRVALSRDGRVLAGGRGDGTIVVWQASGDPPVTTISSPHGTSHALALSGDGRLLASGSPDGTLSLWAVRGGRLLTSLNAHAGYVRSAALSGDGSVAASTGPERVVKVWDTSTGQQVTSLEDQAASFGRVALSWDGQTATSSSADGIVRVWHVTSRQLAASLQGCDQGFDLAVSGDGELVAASCRDGSVLLWETATGRVPAAWRSRALVPRKIVLSADGTTLATQNPDGAVKVWSTSGGKLTANLPEGTAYDIAISGDGRVLATCRAPSGVTLWDAATGRRVANFAGDRPDEVGWGVALSADGKVAASSGGTGTIMVWDVASRLLLARIDGHAGSTLRVALSVDGRVLASRGGDALLKAWDARTGRLLAILDDHTEADSDIVISADGRLIGRGRRDGTVGLWEVPSGRPVASLADVAGLCSVGLSADGTVLATGGIGRIKLWDVAGGRVLADLEVGTEPVYSLALSGDGRLLAHSASFDGADLREMPGIALLRTFRAERPYERMDITRLSGVTEAQWRALVALGATQRDA
jgi:WD40 repeat protein/DNA-binding XRE family transcriptional regulator